MGHCRPCKFLNCIAHFQQHASIAQDCCIHATLFRSVICAPHSPWRRELPLEPPLLVVRGNHLQCAGCASAQKFCGSTDPDQHRTLIKTPPVCSKHRQKQKRGSSFPTSISRVHPTKNNEHRSIGVWMPEKPRLRVPSLHRLLSSSQQQVGILESTQISVWERE